MNALLNETFHQLRNAETVEAPVAGLISSMYAYRKEAGEAEWRDCIESGIRRHQVYPLLLEDPFVGHAAVRPRGYPGDAELIDYIYGSANVRPMIDGASALGRRLYAFDRDTPAPAAVRNRLQMAAAEVDRMAVTGMRPHVLSIACGHLREAGLLESLRNGTLGRFVGVDQDPLSLELVRREWGHLGVEARECDARMLIRRGLSTLGKFDFIYSLGLYDYLSDKAAARLLATAVDMLKPGGKIWIANFTQDIWTAAYMEAVMDWWLIYRTKEQMNGLAAAIDPAKIASRRTFMEPARNVVFLEVVRA
jgi:extracellular factor (EF) 3-hydroxypalmitic acid methyl ester biosynthesis protein